MAASASSEPVSCYSETVAGDDDCRTSSYADEKDDYIDEFVTTRAQDTSTKCKSRKLRDIPVSEKVSGALDRMKLTSIRTPTMISVLNEVALSTSSAVLTKQRVGLLSTIFENSQQIRKNF